MCCAGHPPVKNSFLVLRLPSHTMFLPAFQIFRVFVFSHRSFGTRAEGSKGVRAQHSWLENATGTDGPSQLRKLPNQACALSGCFFPRFVFSRTRPTAGRGVFARRSLWCTYIYIYTYFFPSVFCGENITELLSSNDGSLRKIAGITPFLVGYVRLGVESTLLLHRSTTVKAN